MQVEKIVIIGASHGGVQLATSLREAKFEGEITLIGDENVTPYHRPPLSKAWLQGEASELQVLKAPQFFADHNIDFLNHHHVATIDRGARTVTLENGDELAYTNLCIATGARPRPLNIPGADGKKVFEMRNALDASNLRAVAGGGKRIAVLGGGFIGLEAAASLKKLGNEVSVFEAASRLMGRAVAPEISTHVLNRYQAFGIEVHLDQMCSEIILDQGKVTGIKTADAEFSADIVLVGVGVIPNQEIALQAGIACENGILVDAQMRTSDPNIFAIGDVANYQHWQLGTNVRLESVQNAVDQAKHVAKILTGGEGEYHNVPWFWSDQIDMKLQMAGLSHHSNKTVSRKYEQENKLSVFHYHGEKLVAVDTINAPADHMVARRLIGAGVSPTIDEAADPEFALKSLL